MYLRSLKYWKIGGGGGQPDFSDFPDPDFGKINFHIGKIGKQFFANISLPDHLGHMLIHSFYINVLIALILVYRNSM